MKFSLPHDLPRMKSMMESETFIMGTHTLDIPDLEYQDEIPASVEFLVDIIKKAQAIQPVEVTIGTDETRGVVIVNDLNPYDGTPKSCDGRRAWHPNRPLFTFVWMRK